MKKKYDKTIGRVELWNYYDKNYNSDKKINKSTFKKYLDIIFDSIIEYIISGGYFILPYSLGTIKIVRMPEKKRLFITPEGEYFMKPYFINFNETRKYREKMKKELGDEFFKKGNENKFIVPFDNKDTGGVFYSILQEIDEEYTRRKYLPFAFFKWKAMKYFKLKFYNYLKTTKQIPVYYEQNKHRPYYRKNTKKNT